MLRYMRAQAFITQEQNLLRVVFTLVPPSGNPGDDNKDKNGETRDAPTTSL
jgi:hypothetical protein